MLFGVAGACGQDHTQTAAKPKVFVSSTTTSTTTSVSSSSNTASSSSTSAPDMPRLLYEIVPRDPIATKAKYENYSTTTTQPEALPEEGDCGGLPGLCLVEYSTNAVGKPPCCDESNNKICEQCLPHCKRICISRGYGVKSCFMDGSEPHCQCSRGLPVCYDLKPATTTTRLPDVGGEVTTKGASAMSYLVVVGVLIIALVAAVEFVHRADRS